MIISTNHKKFLLNQWPRKPHKVFNHKTTHPSDGLSIIPLRKMREAVAGSLQVHEWLAVTLFLGILIFLTFVSSFSNKPPSFHPLTSSASKELVVEIQGAVEHPGIYHLKPGTQMEALLQMAIPTKEANLRKVKRRTKLYHGQVLTIPEQQMITITLKGAVQNPGTYKIPKGSNRQYLLNTVQFFSEADLQMLQNKRKLKDKEEITIPVKSSS